MYKVVECFCDLTDDCYAYNIGDVYPRKGVKVSEKRIRELSTANNKRGVILIAEVKETKQKAEKKPKEE